LLQDKVSYSYPTVTLGMEGSGNFEHKSNIEDYELIFYAKCINKNRRKESDLVINKLDFATNMAEPTKSMYYTASTGNLTVYYPRYYMDYTAIPDPVVVDYRINGGP
jgi:hypothetical protein